jgi:hypothetical protein
VVCINETVDLHCIPLWLGCIGWFSLLGASVEICPILLGKIGFIPVNPLFVKDD